MLGEAKLRHVNMSICLKYGSRTVYTFLLILHILLLGHRQHHDSELFYNIALPNRYCILLG